MKSARRIIGLLLVLTAFCAHAQTPFSRDYYLNESASPVNVNALVQDGTGFLWIGTDAGLYRFNGVRFILLKDSAAVPVTALTVIGNKIWIGYKNGEIGYVNDKDIVRIRQPRQPVGAITALYGDVYGTLWITTEEEGVKVWFGEHMYAFNAANGLPDNFTYAVAMTAPGHVFIAADNGLNELDYTGHQPKVQVIKDTLPDNIIRVIQRIPHTTNYWIGAQQGGLAIYNSTSHKAVIPHFNTPWTWGQVNDILPLSDTIAWVATEDGYLLEVILQDALHGTIHPYYYGGKNLRKLLLDKTGNIWCATNTGIKRVTAPYAAYIPLTKPYALQNVTAIAGDKNGQIWLAEDRQLYRLSLQDFPIQPVLVYTAGTKITSLFVDPVNRLWIGTLGTGLSYKAPGKEAIQQAGMAAIAKENILSITGTDQSLWIAGLNGVKEISYPDVTGNQQVISQHGKSSGVGTDYVYQLYADHHKNIWMATDGAGICQYTGHTYRYWDASSGMDSKVAYSLTEDSSGDMWAATLDKGLYRLHNNHWQPMGVKEGLQHINISALSTTGAGQVISINIRGIDQWDPASSQIRHYSRRLGMDIDTVSTVLNCIARDAGGNVYVPFEHGLIVLKNQRHLNINPGVHIAQVGLFMKPVSPGRHTFGHNENYLSFTFEGLNFTNPEPLNYRYMLMGYNNHWIATNDETITFPNLPPGKYTFRLQSSLNHNFNNAVEDRYAFTITTPFWKRIPFILAMLVLLALVVFGYVKRREKRLKSISRLQQERMTFEYEHLKSQVNPHFLFNTLNTLTNLIEEDPARAVSYTEQLADLYRNMLLHRDKDLIPLREEWHILEAYLYIQQSRFGNALQVHLHLPEALLDTRRIVPMSLQMLVENAIKHNVVSMSAPLVITIFAEAHHILITNPVRPKMSKEKGAGLGLENICRRYELMTDRKMTYGIIDHIYTVTLPLL